VGTDLDLNTSIKTWIETRLSTPLSFLGNIPPCPFARDAFFKNKIQVFDASSQTYKDALNQQLLNFHKDSTKEMSILAVTDWQNCNPHDVQLAVSNLREKYFSQDLWTLYDHPSLPEVIDGFSLNHGQLLIFMIQRLSTLVAASNELKAHGYYDRWPHDYYNEVVGQRADYYQRYLAGTTAANAFVP
jgi:hypothetical protein